MIVVRILCSLLIRFWSLNVQAILGLSDVNITGIRQFIWGFSSDKSITASSVRWIGKTYPTVSCLLPPSSFALFLKLIRLLWTSTYYRYISSFRSCRFRSQKIHLMWALITNYSINQCPFLLMTLTAAKYVIVWGLSITQLVCRPIHCEIACGRSMQHDYNCRWVWELNVNREREIAREKMCERERANNLWIQHLQFCINIFSYVTDWSVVKTGISGTWNVIFWSVDHGFGPWSGWTWGVYYFCKSMISSSG